MFALLQEEKEDRKRVMLGKDPTSTLQERFALVAKRGRGQNNIHRDELHCTHSGKNRHTHEYFWDLDGNPPHFNTTNTPKTEKSNNGKAQI